MPPHITQLIVNNDEWDVPMHKFMALHEVYFGLSAHQWKACKGLMDMIAENGQLSDGDYKQFACFGIHDEASFKHFLVKAMLWNASTRQLPCLHDDGEIEDDNKSVRKFVNFCLGKASRFHPSFQKPDVDENRLFDFLHAFPFEALVSIGW